jgi:large subunit ribosomal protein L32
MALPKRKISRSKRDKRRTHKKLSSPQYSTCPQCQEVKLPHRVCMECGYYNGQEIIKLEAQE